MGLINSKKIGRSAGMQVLDLARGGCAAAAVDADSQVTT
jgi:hypothetical protein